MPLLLCTYGGTCWSRERPTHWDKPLCSGFLLRVIWQLGLSSVGRQQRMPPIICWSLNYCMPFLKKYPFNTIGWFAGVRRANNFTFIVSIRPAGFTDRYSASYAWTRKPARRLLTIQFLFSLRPYYVTFSWFISKQFLLPWVCYIWALLVLSI